MASVIGPTTHWSNIQSPMLVCRYSNHRAKLPFTIMSKAVPAVCAGCNVSASHRVPVYPMARLDAFLGTQAPHLVRTCLTRNSNTCFLPSDTNTERMWELRGA